MEIKDYRRKIEEEISRARATDAEPRWNAALESSGGIELLGQPSQEDSAAHLRTVLSDRGLDSKLRCAALGQLVEKHTDRENMHEEPLARLADSDETPDLRLAALQILKVATFHSPTAPDWQPDYKQALRDTSQADDMRLRYTALATLAAMKDRSSQEVLMQGLAQPEKARVSPQQALQLLSKDPHSGVQEIAQRFADDRSDEAARLEALRVLANDPGSARRFRSLFLDSEERPEVRKLAATALYSLAPESLREIVAGMESQPSRREGLESTQWSISDQHALLHAKALLK